MEICICRPYMFVRSAFLPPPPPSPLKSRFSSYTHSGGLEQPHKKPTFSCYLNSGSQEDIRISHETPLWMNSHVRSKFPSHMNSGNPTGNPHCQTTSDQEARGLKRMSYLKSRFRAGSRSPPAASCVPPIQQRIQPPRAAHPAANPQRRTPHHPSSRRGPQPAHKNAPLATHPAAAFFFSSMGPLRAHRGQLAHKSAPRATYPVAALFSSLWAHRGPTSLRRVQPIQPPRSSFLLRRGPPNVS